MGRRELWPRRMNCIRNTFLDYWPVNGGDWSSENHAYKIMDGTRVFMMNTVVWLCQARFSKTVT